MCIILILNEEEKTSTTGEKEEEEEKGQEEGKNWRPFMLVLCVCLCAAFLSHWSSSSLRFLPSLSSIPSPHPPTRTKQVKMPDDGAAKPAITFAGRFTASAIAACFAEVGPSLPPGSPQPPASDSVSSRPQVCTIPLDTAKVRLQLQKSAAGADVPKYRGLLGTAATIAREEGAAALWKGIVPGLHRQCIYGGLRIGLYEPVRTPLLAAFCRTPRMRPVLLRLTGFH